MEGRRWAVVDSILGAALERAPHEREAFVQQTCADDEELRRDVESLLAQVRGADDFLEPPARRLLDVAAASGRDSVPDSFGPYRMLEPLGNGGMGDVYRARESATWPAIRDWLKSVNRYGYDELIEKFRDARQRGLWSPRSNSVYAFLEGEA